MQGSIMNYSDHAVHYIPMEYLFYNWNFVPFDPFDPFSSLLTLASGNHQSIMWTW